MFVCLCFINDETGNGTMPQPSPHGQYCIVSVVVVVVVVVVMFLVVDGYD